MSMHLRPFLLLPMLCLALPACDGPDTGGASVDPHREAPAASGSTPASGASGAKGAAAPQRGQAAATPKNWMWDEKRSSNPLGQKPKNPREHR